MFKINIDGSYNGMVSGLGVIIRSCKGKCIGVAQLYKIWQNCKQQQKAWKLSSFSTYIIVFQKEPQFLFLAFVLKQYDSMAILATS